ncbi:hypothetical protein D3C86_373880 [compost metagenome]
MPDSHLLAKRLVPVLALTVAMHAGSAHAYPNAVIFTPSGEAKAFGEASVLTYVAYFGDSPLTWAGINVGLLPRFAYGDTGLDFGGLELGLDLIGMAGLSPAKKPVMNGKAQLLVENGPLPSVAVGLSGFAVADPTLSLNATYLSATKTLAWSEHALGRITLGGGVSLARSQAVFTATTPFAAPSQAFVLGGYESPAWGPATFAVDHIGGISELGATTLGLNLLVSPGTYLGLGYTLGNDRSAVPADAAYVYLSSGFSLAAAKGEH